jgi:hypothetical protein
VHLHSYILALAKLARSDDTTDTDTLLRMLAAVIEEAPNVDGQVVKLEHVDTVLANGPRGLGSIEPENVLLAQKVAGLAWWLLCIIPFEYQVRAHTHTHAQLHNMSPGAFVSRVYLRRSLCCGHFCFSCCRMRAHALQLTPPVRVRAAVHPRRRVDVGYARKRGKGGRVRLATGGRPALPGRVRARRRARPRVWCVLR